MLNNLRGVATALLIATATACGDDPPVEPLLTGYEGDWIAQVNGSPMTLRIGEFFAGVVCLNHDSRAQIVHLCGARF